MAFHTKYSLRRPSIFEILNLLLAISTFEAGRAESLIARKDCQILDLVPADTTAVCTIVAYERPVAEEEEVRIRVEDGTAGIAAEAVYMPSIARWKPVSVSISQCHHSPGMTYQVRKPCLPRGSRRHLRC